MVTLQKLAFVTGLILIVVGSYAAYMGYTESKLMMTFGVGQTKAWIFGEPIYGYAIDTQPPTNHEIQLTQEELARYPTLKAYIDYLDTVQGIIPHSSRSIDPTEARKLLLFLSQRASYEVKPEPDSPVGEIYSLNIVLQNPLSKVLPSSRYDISILFNDNQPVLD
jgi:hypothetical protein